MIRLDELVATRLTTQVFEDAPGFSLTGFWPEHAASADGESH